MEWNILSGDCRKFLPEISKDSVQATITSPPYWQLRDYDAEEELGHEALAEYVTEMGNLFDLVKTATTHDGVLWLNLGDTYAGGGGYCPTAPSNIAGSKQSTNRGSLPKARPVPAGYKKKDLLGVPWLVAFELQKRGWYLRCDVIWEKTNAFPEAVKDRPARSHEYLFLFSKNSKYYFDNTPVMEPAADGGSRTCRSTWRIAKSNYKGIHTAIFPEELVRRCLLSATQPQQLVLDPFAGSGTTGVVAKKLGRNFLGIEANHDYATIALERIASCHCD